MSYDEKSRKMIGSTCITFSFILFTLAVCSVWVIFVIYRGVFMMLCGVLPLLLFITSFCLAGISCKAYIGVSEKEICNSSSAKLQKLNGIFELVKSFIFLALTISCLWVIFVFYEISTCFLLFVIPFWLCFSEFMLHSNESYNNFTKIEKLVKK